jgi:hypothetical protein
MKGIKSFSRNAYYKGKLLTEKDFELEQHYHNVKRQLINKTLYGSGVVTGLRVVQLDKENICIEPGIAFDIEGREIIVETPIVTKLESISGFYETDEENDLLLGLTYDEKSQEDTQTLGAFDNQHSDLILETHSLAITEYSPDLYMNSKRNMSHYKQEIFSSEDTKISIVVPKFLSKSHPCDICFDVVHLKEEKNVRILGTYLETNMKKVGDQSIDLVFDQNLFKKKQLSKSITLYSDCVGDIEANFTIRKEELEFFIDDKRFGLEEHLNFNIYITDDTYSEELKKRFNNQTVNDMQSKIEPTNTLYLARVFVEKNGFDYKINQVINLPFDQDIGKNAYLDLLSSQNRSHEPISRDQVVVEKQLLEPKEARDGTPITSYGRTVIDFSLRAKRNMCFTTPELSHDLGMGIVNVSVGFETRVEDEDVYVTGSMTAIDRKEYPVESPNFEYAVLAYPNKGTFKIHLRLLENTEIRGLKISWFARKDQEPINQIDEQTRLNITPDSIVMEPKETVLFKASVLGVRNQDVVWKVADAEGGKIAENGLYEAPKKIGVYKIMARSVENQNVESLAFVVVKEKTK